MQMTAEQRTKIEGAINLVMPETKELVASLMNDPFKTTQNNYGKAMAFLSSLEKTSPVYAKVFLMAMQRAGYPAITVAHLRQIMGW